MKILIIDSYNMIHRARHSFKFSKDNTTFGFFRCLKSEIDRHEPDSVFIVSEGSPKHRKELFPSYKANRDKKIDKDFLRQIDDIFELCKYLPLTVIRHPDYECDDVIAMICNNSPDSEITICSSDSDFIQLIEENVKLWNPIKKKFIEKWPVDYLIWKSLKGDSSDNIPGVKGVGDKTATKLAASSDKLNEFFEKKPLLKKDFDLALELIKFKNIDLNDNMLECSSYNFSEDLLKSSFEKLSFKSITEKSWGSWKTTFGALNDGKTINISRA